MSYEDGPRLVTFKWLLICCLTLTAFASAAEPPPDSYPLAAPFPWTEQRPIISGWTITAVERREDFARLTLRRDSTETGVEIDPAASEDEWSTRFYRVQPAPGHTPPKELLHALVEDLREWEQQPGHMPFLVRFPDHRGIFDPKDRGTGRAITRLLFVILLTATAAFTAAVVWLQVPDRRDRRVVVATGTLIGLAAVIVFEFVPPARIPAEWVVTLTNGLTRDTISRVLGRELHAGPGYVFLTDVLASGPSERLRAIVRMNLWLSGVDTVLFLFIARTLAGGIWPALVLTFWFVVNWAFVNAASSEVPSQTLTLLLLLGAITVRQIHRSQNRVPDSENLADPLRCLQRQSGLFLLLLLVIWAGTIRIEFAVAGVIVLLSIRRGRSSGAPTHPAGRLSGDLARPVHTGFRSPLVRLPIVLAVCAVYRFLDGRLDRPGQLLLHGLMPFDEGIFTLPLALTLFLPPVLVALIVIGFWRCMRDGGPGAGLAVALVFLHKCYVAYTAGGPTIFDLLRWWANVIPAAILFAAVGWRSVAPPWQRWRTFLLTVLLLPGSWHSRLWPVSLALSRAVIRCGFAVIGCWPEISSLLQRIPSFRVRPSARFRIAAWEWPFSGILAGFLLWWPAQVPPVRYDSWRTFLAHPPGYRLVNNQIREARFLIETFDRNPDAVLAAEVWRDGGPAHDWTFAGGRLEQALDVYKDARPLPEVVGASVPFVSRVVLYRGLDCNVAGAEPCFDPLWPVTAEKRFTSLPSSGMELARLPTGSEILLSVRAIVR